MSSSIWTRCAGDSERRPLRLAPWRVVESQHEVSTRKLVDSADEQALLEELVERVKPPPVGSARQHYLLTTPFRYPPLRHGSRFGTRTERGIWYGSETLRTAFTEVAYYRLLFLEGTRAPLAPLTASLTAFTVRARTANGVDLVAPPFDAHRDTIASPVAYAETQLLGRAMRAAGVELFRFPSARDPDGGVNVGAFTPAVFGRAAPRRFQRWHCVTTAVAVEFVRRDPSRDRRRPPERERVDRVSLLVGGELPSPAG
jgi:hypothetical protein